MATGWVYLSLGRTDRQLRWRLLGSSAAVAGMVAGLPWGAIGVAIGLSASRVLMRLPAVIYCFHGTPLVLSDLGSVVWRTVIASAGAGILTWLFDPEMLPAGGRLLVQTGVFFATWLGVMLLVPGGAARLRAGVGLVQDIRRGEVAHAA